MTLHNRDIVCLSTHYWNERWFRKQEFMARFSRNNRVLYVEPSFSMARRPDPHLVEVARNRFVLPRLESASEHLTLLKPPRGLPKWSSPTIERLTYEWYGKVIARALHQLDFHDVILWVYRPSYAHALRALPYRHLVFDLVDDIAAYGGHESGMPHVERDIRRLVAASDLFVVTAKTLAARYGAAARNLVQIANGFDATRFEPAAKYETPGVLRGIPRPLLGFIGTLFAFLDFDLLTRVARSHPDKSLVLVGPVEESARSAFDRLTREPNVHYLGAQPQAEIPAFLAEFDVCLNVFRTSRATDSVIPLKVFEYMAAGKPIVSTPMQALQQEEAVCNQITFAATPERFNKAIERALRDSGVVESARRREAAASYTWERLFDQLAAACAAALENGPSYGSVTAELAPGADNPGVGRSSSSI